ncbi:hypothetical protein SAMN05444354_11549 [Stigmatella aurantiaca]|uniref:Uncharacterized protein n=1 Tax=Stigmatella aurantiaca TaxID=41 RepID=A0A1H7XJW7_STIAU|nr:hypothetical protein [Stigmatella aurantiaca]SEM33953.1 hypothetical protein SAMN05444354_11549 [Stigmatella aurantiaca]
MHPKRIGITLSALIYGLLLSGCGQLTESDQPPSGKAETGAAEVPFDVQKVMDQVHFAFRPQGTAWEGGHNTYSVRVDEGGFSVTPYHHPRHQPEEAGPQHPALARVDARQEELSLSPVMEGAPVRFGAAIVSRGGMVRSSLKAQGHVKTSGALGLTRGDVEELFRNDQDGVEQSWNFERQPRGTGDLEVRVPVENGRFLGETAKGLHFASGTTGLGVRYGHGTWIDAQGQRTAVPARFETGAIVLKVPAEVVDASAYPALLDPLVNPEFGMDEPVYGPADRSQSSSAVAYDGTNFLVVWQDSRRGNTDIYGTRVNGTGTVIDIAGIPISTAINTQSYPAVAYNGTHFLVVWQDSRNGSYDIYGARVSSAGTVLDTSGIPISTATYSQYYPSVTHDGTNFLVVWDDIRGSNYDIYAARVNNAGSVLDLSGIPVSTATGSQRYPAAAYNGTNFLVVWQDTRSGTSSDIYGARISTTGTVLNPNGIMISNAVSDQQTPVVAYNGSDFLVIWQDTRSGSSYDIYGARVSGTGVVRNPNGIPIATGTSNQRAPSVARGGTDCFVVWTDDRMYEVYGARISNTGVLLETNGIRLSGSADDSDNPAVSYDGTNFFTVWENYAGPNSPNIHGARVSGTGTLLDTSKIHVSTSANGQYSPAVAHDGTNFFVVWQDYRNGGQTDIYGVLVSEMGEVLDTSGIPISTAVYNQYNPAVAHDGTNFLVVWDDTRGASYDIYGTRVSGTGTVLDTGGIPISTAAGYQYRPAVAYNGATFLVVWEDTRGGTYDVYGARVSSAGTVIDTSGVPITSATGDQRDPVVSYNGNFLVVWEDNRSGNYDIYGSRVSGTGTVLDINGIAISTNTSSQTNPSIAHDGLYFLVVWEDTRSGTSDIYGARLNTGGIVLDTGGISISTATNSQNAPAVAYDGTNFLVVWQDYRGGSGFSDIYGARVGQPGTVLESSGIAIATEQATEAEPILTAMGAESSLVVYRSSHVSASTHSERVRARLVQFP